MRNRKCLPFKNIWFVLGFHRVSCCPVICVSLFQVIVLSFGFWLLIVHFVWLLGISIFFFFGTRLWELRNYTSLRSFRLEQRLVSIYKLVNVELQDTFIFKMTMKWKNNLHMLLQRSNICCNFRTETPLIVFRLMVFCTKHSGAMSYFEALIETLQNVYPFCTIENNSDENTLVQGVGQGRVLSA